MKKSLLALAVLGAFAGVASAQSSVTLYGKIDLSYVNEGGPAGTTNKLTSGVSGGSRIGLRGAEDLGGGLKAIFTAETGFCADSTAGGGFCTGGGVFMGRQAFVGLDGGFGKLTLGRQYTPQFLVMANADPFGFGYEGSIANATSYSLRANNAVIYSIPNMSGFGASAMYAFGEKTGNNSAGQEMGLSLGYNNGPLGVNYGYDKLKDAVTGNTDTTRSTLVGSYDFGVVKPVLLYHTAKNSAVGGIDNRSLMAGLTAPLGAGSLMFSYIKTNDRTAAKKDTSQVAIGYQYNLSKRTGVHVSYAKISNKNGAAYTVGNATDGGTGDRGFAVGVVHNF